MAKNILTSTEFTNRLKSIYHFMCKNEQYKIELIYQKFQIGNFSIEQVFHFVTAGLSLPSSDGDILLKNYFDVKILPYDYLIKIIIDWVNVAVRVREIDLYKLPCEYKYIPHCVHVVNPGEITDEVISVYTNYIHRLLRSRLAHKYSLLQIDYSKLINFIDLASIKYI